MADRRRKRTTASSFDDGIGKDVLPGNRARRRSDYGSHVAGSSARAESWMAKVTSAMSHRLFSHSKKLNGSRSTQVMPMTAVAASRDSNGVGWDKAATTRLSASLVSPPAHEMELQPASNDSSSSAAQSLRQASSEQSLAVAQTLTEISPVLTFTEASRYPIASSDGEGGSQEEQQVETHRPSRRSQSCQSHGPARQKVMPGDGEAEMEDLSDGFRSVYAARTRTEARHEPASDASVESAAPILKGFFSRDACAGQKLRERQSERRRETLYSESKRRQSELRLQAEREHAASEDARRRRKAEQLRRLGQQRRLQLRRTAADARVTLLQTLQEDEMRYASERKRWEGDFEDEMRVLSDAFRKAQAAQHRPMTVAGLAVPEAISQLERDAVNAQRRVQTAAASVVATDIPRRRPGSASGASKSEDVLASAFFESCEVLALEDSKEVFDLLQDDESTMGGQGSELTRQSDVEALLDEREGLLQRLAAIERMVQAQQ